MPMLLILLIMALGGLRAQEPVWDVAGTQGRVGFIVNSGLGEPLSIKLVPMQADELKGAVAMRVYANGQRLGLHMGQEMDADTAIIVPDCADTVMIVVLRGRNFEAELEPIDTGVIVLTPRPISATISNAKLTRPAGRPEIIITGLQVVGASVRSDLDATIQIVSHTLRDTSGTLVQLKPEQRPERAVGPGQATYTLDVITWSKADKPYTAKLTGSVEISFTLRRTVCGQTVRKTLTTVIGLKAR